MANYSGYRVNIGAIDYPAKFDNLITELEDRANEMETARGIYATLDERMDVLQSTSLGLTSHFLSSY